ncbi:hypothetical protein Tco_0681234 [Tanacetum coccineum]|uniref:Gag-Pol polyprotein n=1 Tax=Tanacetum coccineum TaxID=301880 RepID=A0ABQ4XPE4_9ASTR
MKNNPVCKENASNVFRKEREQYHEIQDLKAQMQDKNMVINELKKLILVTKGKSVETQFDKPSVVRQPNAQRIPKPSVLGKPTPFSNSPEMRSFQTNKSVNKTNASDGLFKPVTQQNLPQKRNQAVRNTNVASEKKPGMFRIAFTTTQTRTPQLPHVSRNTNPHMSKSSGVIHTTSVSRPQLKCYQVKDKVVPNNSQVKFQKKEVEDHHRISIEESLNVTFDESPPPTKLSPLVDDDVGEEEAIKRNTKVVNNINEEDESIEVDEIVNIKESKNHPLDQVIGNLNQRTLRSQAQNHSNFFCFISTIEPKNINEALKDKSWIVAMQEELNQFVANDV